MVYGARSDTLLTLRVRGRTGREGDKGGILGFWGSEIGKTRFIAYEFLALRL